MKTPPRGNKLAGIPYVGQAGITDDCEGAILRLLQCRENISAVRILTASNRHCLLLTNEIGDQTAVKSGFTSGYGGGGPSAFSRTLQLLEAHGANIDEYEIDDAVMERLDLSALTLKDLDHLETSRPIRPSRWHDYIFERDYERMRDGRLWATFVPVVPFGIMDARIVDLARSFWENPDEKLMTGYRRLEEIVRTRTGLHAHGQKLFSQTFLDSPPRLIWEDIDKSEQQGRAQLFVAAYMAHRNRRAHNEPKEHQQHDLSEFLVLNHLYQLEKEAVAATPSDSPIKAPQSIARKQRAR